MASTDDARPGRAGPPPRAFVRRSTAPPDPAELDRLAALVRSAPLFAASPSGPALAAFAPHRPRAGRNAAVDWRIRGGTPGDSVDVRLEDAGGTLDSARIRLDDRGEAAGAFRARPADAGWHAWTVRALDGEAAAGAWVLPEVPLRIVLAGAAGSVEAREVARALERGGATVTLATDLGRGLALGASPPGVPDLAAALDSVDVVIALAGAPVSADAASALAAFVRRGGGVAIAGQRGATTIPGIGGGAAVAMPATALRWTLPAPIEPLPPIDETIEAEPVAPAGEGRWSAASLGETSVLVLGTGGRGRWAALGITDTWPWALRAGRGAALSAFWASLADWLAAGAAEPVALTVEPATAPPGLPVDVRLVRFDTAAVRPDSVLIRHADGRAESLTVAWVGDEGVARFVATAEGPIEVHVPPLPSVAGGHLAATSARPAADAWARLAAIAVESGGRMTAADALDAAADGTPRFPWRTVVVLAVGVLASAGWAVRRLRGMP